MIYIYHITEYSFSISPGFLLLAMGCVCEDIYLDFYVSFSSPTPLPLSSLSLCLWRYLPLFLCLFFFPKPSPFVLFVSVPFKFCLFPFSHIFALQHKFQISIYFPTPQTSVTPHPPHCLWLIVTFISRSRRYLDVH